MRRNRALDQLSVLHLHPVGELMKRIVVIGLGNFGMSVAETLAAQQHETIAVDTNGEAVDRVANLVARAAVGDGTNVRTLERIGARGADAGVISTGDDITASILSTLALKDLGIPELYVKVVSRDHARVMERLGVTETIFPERESAISLGRRMSGSSLLNYVRLGAGLSIQEMGVPQAWTGKNLRELELRRRFGLTVVAVHDVLTDRMVVASDPEVVLKESDTLVVAGRDEDLMRAAQVK